MKKKIFTLPFFLKKGSTGKIAKGNELVAFTLIELMIVITIMIMMVLTAYTPFSHYQTKQKVNNSAKIITQALNDSRNLSIYGIASSTGNLDIGVLFKKNDNNIYILKYPFDNLPIDYNNENKYLLKKIPLEGGTQITSSGGLFLYKAITGSGIYKNFPILSSKIELKIGMKGATSGPFIKTIEYYTKTYVSDIH